MAPHHRAGLLALLAIQGLSGCAERAGEHREGEPEMALALPAGIEVVREVELQELDSVVNARPLGTISPRGNLVLADIMEGRVRIYSPEGALLRQLGCKGDGPGEFVAPVQARVTADGSLFVGDVPRGIHHWSGEDLREYELHRPGLQFQFGTHALDDSLLLVAGLRPGAPNPHLLHLFDLSTGDVTRSFFPIPLPPDAQQGSALMVAMVASDIREDEVAAAFSLSDTIFVFGLPEGRLKRKVHLAIPGFIQDPFREGGSEWQSRIRLLRGVHWLPGGGYLVHFASAGPSETTGLMLTGPEGEVLHTWWPSPEPLAVDWPDIYLFSPSSLEPNKLLVVRYRLGVS